MTRNEALSKMLNVDACGNMTGEKFLKALETLGLIKFDDPPKVKTYWLFEDGGGNQYKIYDKFLRHGRE